MFLPFYKLLGFLTQHCSSSIAPFPVQKSKDPSDGAQLGTTTCSLAQISFLEHHCSVTTPKYFISVGWVKCNEFKKKKKLETLHKKY